MLKSSIEGGIFGEGPVAPARVRPTRDHDIFAPDHSPPVKPEQSRRGFAAGIRLFTYADVSTSALSTSSIAPLHA